MYFIYLTFKRLPFKTPLYVLSLGIKAGIQPICTRAYLPYCYSFEVSL